MRSAVSLAVVAILASRLVTMAAQSRKDVVDYVSPNIGGIGILLTSTIPYVQVPHGMARLYPITTPGIGDRYLADKIYGFPAGPAMLMASVGMEDTHAATYASDFDHDFEMATPYYYEADLETSGIKAELTATRSAAYYRFTFPASDHGHLAFSLGDHAEVSVVGPRAIEGSEEVGGTVSTVDDHAGTTRQYFYAELSRSLSSWQTWRSGRFSQIAQQTGDDVGLVTDSPTAAGEVVEVRIGLSYISAEQARQNLEREIPAWNFDGVKAETREVWNRTLGAIVTTGGTEQQRTIFYTALYRSLCRMTDITEDGRYFSGYDHQVHNADGHDFYVDDGLWDTFRSEHPLQILLDARRQEDEAISYIREAFNAKLDRLFIEPLGTSKWHFLDQFPDATGLVGLYAQGNEPSFHIAYLYDFSGQPWKTQRRVRQLMDLWYTDGPMGIPGDDDGGETSSWYVFSAMGFYPVCPGSPVYEIGSPLFARTIIHMGNGKDFTIIADRVSAQNKYIETAVLNGQPLEKPWFRHQDIANGGTLTLEMGDKPNTSWGSAAQDAPPSMSFNSAE